MNIRLTFTDECRLKPTTKLDLGTDFMLTYVNIRLTFTDECRLKPTTKLTLGTDFMLT